MYKSAFTLKRRGISTCYLVPIHSFLMSLFGPFKQQSKFLPNVQTCTNRKYTSFHYNLSKHTYQLCWRTRDWVWLVFGHCKQVLERLNSYATHDVHSSQVNLLEIPFFFLKMNYEYSNTMVKHGSQSSLKLLIFFIMQHLQSPENSGFFRVMRGSKATFSASTDG